MDSNLNNEVNSDEVKAMKTDSTASVSTIDIELLEYNLGSQPLSSSTLARAVNKIGNAQTFYTGEGTLQPNQYVWVFSDSNYFAFFASNDVELCADTFSVETNSDINAEIPYFKKQYGRLYKAYASGGTFGVFATKYGDKYAMTVR